MKFPLMLRSTHEFEVGALKDEINILKDDYKVIDGKLYIVNQIASSLENRNCELAVKLTVASTRANKYENWYNNLTYVYRDGQNELNDTIKELNEIKRELESNKKKVNAFGKLCSEYKEQIEIYERDILGLGDIYNHMNRKLWSNDEAKRQLRNLADEIRDADKINKNYIAKYLSDLSMLIGGGEIYTFKGLKEEEEAIG